MIYLLSQMVFALVLAAVSGGALGWILHRSTQDRESGNFKNIMNRQRQQLSHLQSEIAMLTDDYDELQRQSHDEMIELREANQQIPYLSSNLEKSQLLVSQMLKKHDSQLRELNTQNQKLTTKLANAEHSEQAFNTLQAELDSVRRTQVSSRSESESETETETESETETVTGNDINSNSNSGSNTDSDTGSNTGTGTGTGTQTSATTRQSTDESTTTANISLSAGSANEPLADVAKSAPSEDTSHPVSGHTDQPVEKITGFDSESGESLDDSDPAASTPVVTTRSSQVKKPDALNDTQRIVSNIRNTHSWASAPLSALQTETSQEALADKTPNDEASPIVSGGATTLGNELLDEDLDNVHVVVDDDILGINDFETDSDINDLGDATISLTDDDFDELNSNEEFAQTVDNSPVIFLNADATETEADEHNAPSGLTARPAARPDTELELPELPQLPSDVFDVDPFDQVIEIGDDLQKELDEDDDGLNAFEPVERHDDLQQIVGIDPRTEKALNDLGITSYAQLARLEHHEIETIANALEIVPARIRSDDWVGNARRQLEDVLEEL